MLGVVSTCGVRLCAHSCACAIRRGTNMAAATHGTINAPRMPIAGDDFGGSAVARELAYANAHVILVGWRNHHRRQPTDTLTSPDPDGEPGRCACRHRTRRLRIPPAMAGCRQPVALPRRHPPARSCDASAQRKRPGCPGRCWHRRSLRDGRSGLPQAANKPRIFFIALASTWRMRSAETPYSSARSCNVALLSLSSQRRWMMSRERLSRWESASVSDCS